MSDCLTRLTRLADEDRLNRIMRGKAISAVSRAFLDIRIIRKLIFEILTDHEGAAKNG